MKFAIALACLVAASVAGAQDGPGMILRPLGSSTTITLTGLDYHCEGKQGGSGHGPTGKYDDCTGIPVIVLEDAQGECWSFLPYNRLVVHRKDSGGSPRDIDIEWQLQQTDRFRFDTSKRGIDLKNTKQPSGGAAVDPEANHYSRQSSSTKKIRWRLKGASAINFIFDHDAQVIRSADNHTCKAVDPVITNAD